MDLFARLTKMRSFDMRFPGIFVLLFTLSGCVAVWGKGYNVEVQSESGGAIRYDHVLISRQAVIVHASEICAGYDSAKGAVVEDERFAVILPGGSIDEITFSCQKNGRGGRRDDDKSGSNSGTGYMVNSDGNVITNAHVVEECDSIYLKSEGYNYKAHLIATDKVNDLAILDGAGDNLVPVKFRQGKGIRVAEGVVAIGYPYYGMLTTSPQTTTGTVTALAGIGDDSGQLQISAPIQPGNSGGPLFDMSGNVVGTIVSTMNVLAVARMTGTIPQNVNFAIKQSVILGFLNSKGISYALADSSRQLSAADVSELGVKSTVMVVCEK
jgi:S1-C subfamily serine protease